MKRQHAEEGTMNIQEEEALSSTRTQNENKAEPQRPFQRQKEETGVPPFATRNLSFSTQNYVNSYTN